MKEKNEKKNELICFDELEPTKVEWLELEFKDGPSTPKVEAICDIEKRTMK